MAGHRPGHVWLSSTPVAILVVQKKPDYPVSEPDYPVFVGLKPRTDLTPSPVFLSSLSHTQEHP
jgi:hypothetical protein